MDNRLQEISDIIHQGQDIFEKMILKLNHEQRNQLKAYLQNVQAGESMLLPTPEVVVESMIDLLENVPDLTLVKDWINQGKTINAVKEYRALMGVDLKTAHETVKEMALEMGYDWGNR